MHKAFPRRRRQGSGQVRIWVAGQEAADGLIVDELVAGYPDTSVLTSPATFQNVNCA